MKKQLAAACVAALMTATYATADEGAKPKATLKGNMNVVYADKPAEVDSLGAMFTEGMWYGRLRMNNFWWDNSVPAEGGVNNKATGIGGSVVYKTARFATLSATLGAYYSNGGLINKTDAADIGTIRAGKDVLSRYNVKYHDKYDMMVIGQASIDAQIAKTNVAVGRQIFESVFTASNDTKMIPNTFDGIVVENKDIAGTTLRAAHFVSQKLRDHTTGHDVITFSNGQDNWANNDDSAVHKGLSYANFTAAGKDTEHTLSILTAKSKIGEELTTEVSYLMLPEVLNSLVLEANYAIAAGDTKIIPGVRYYMQMDDGGGKIGGASLKGDVTAANAASKGYKTGDSLDSSLLNARLVIQPKGAFKYTLGYSAVADEADIVAPWRGFPTGGYTRAMAQYNWYANTVSYMAQINADLNKAGWVPNTTLMARYAIQDFDDDKTGVQADANILHVDVIHKVAAVQGLELKGRLGMVSADPADTAKKDVSYNEYRFEINYLF